MGEQLNPDSRQTDGPVPKQFVFDQSNMEEWNGKKTRPRTDEEKLHRLIVKDRGGPCPYHKKGKRKVSFDIVLRYFNDASGIVMSDFVTGPVFSPGG